MTVSAAVWEVVGGAKTGGIVVRQEKDRHSEESSTRLMAGALVRPLQYDAATGRMRYELVSGAGPRTGWVTTRTQDKELVKPWQGPLADAPAKGPSKMAVVEEASAPREGMLRKEAPTIGRARRQQNRGTTEVGGLDVVSYSQWQGKGRLGSLNSKIAPKPAREEECGCQVLADDVPLVCPECQLPIGDFAYRSEEGGPLMHGECQAQLLLQRANREEKNRKRRDADLKKSRRAEFDIGWKAERVPRNLACARKMGFAPVANGMYTLTFAEESNTARIAPTANPAAALNLEYLALALQVRMRDGREPMFSLDPKSAEDRAKSQWQVKRFEPAWLAGTSVGDAMFQADVHLKELSMGEYAQPVVGMKSCFDYHEEDAKDVEWNAREWFVVRKAEVHLDGENALMARVNMGVEAREQIAGAKGLEDALLTSPDHPLVRYAQAFEHNFDLIAERKSSVFHLRELTKASVLAKFLVENEVLMEDSFFNFEVEADAGCRPEIPQLWNERFHSQIAVRDGKILDSELGITATKHGLYGGVELGLDRVQAPGVAVRARGPPLVMAKGQLSRAPAASGLLASGAEGFAYTPMPSAAAPRGVDLNLDGFDLAEAKRSEQGAPAFATGSAFFRSLDGAGKGFGEEDLSLLKSLFNPILSDRRAESELFMPPDASPEYLQQLRALVAEEKAAFEQRKEHFLSSEFQRATPGPLFPSDWAPAHGITRGEAQAARELHARKDYGTRMEHMLKTATPVFDKAAEDGTKFRVYELGSLEVRTIQEHDGQERIGVVFSTRAPRSERPAAGDIDSKHDGTIVRATQFVETTQQTKDSKRPPADIRFYVVLETLGGDLIVTEKIGDHVLWVQNPEELEARNSSAKATRSVDCSNLGVTASDVKKRQEEELANLGRTSAECARYAEDIYSVVLPAWQRSWSMLSEKERLAVEQLGVQSHWAQEQGSEGASGLSWGDLDQAQRELACGLGFDEAAWGKSVCWVRAEKRWAQLTSAERQAAGDLGVSGAGAWDGASRKRLQQAGGAWGRSWAELTEAQREAAKVLGVPGAGAWDSACWSVGGAWQRSWAELTEGERQAAEQLGAAGTEAWDRRSARVWRQGWQALSETERAAAGRIGFDRDCWARFA